MLNYLQYNAKMYPEQIALMDSKQQVSYKDLLMYIGTVSLQLKSFGISAGAKVPIIASRSVEHCIYTLALLSMGVIAVPLDINYPLNRLLSIFQSISASYVIIDGDIVNFENYDIQLIKMARLQDIECSTNYIENNVGEVAFISFTSGTTGAPNGIYISHESIISLAQGFFKDKIYNKIRMAHYSNLAFDASLFEIYVSLINAATVIIYKDNIQSISMFKQFLAEYKIESLWLTSALFQLMVEDKNNWPVSLLQLFIGGDILPFKHAKEYFNNYQVNIYNCYGPTENGVFTCCYKLTEDTFINYSTIPIGTAIPGREAYLFKDKNRSEELYISGLGTIHEYVNNQALSKSRHILMPKIGHMLFKTGDLVRRHESGVYLFIGRLDSMVKRSGYRIELSEIDARLLEIQGVITAFSDLISNGNIIDKKIISYVVTTDVSLNASKIYQYLRKYLPDYMLPEIVKIASNLPLTNNYKIDRNKIRNLYGAFHEDKQHAR